MPLDYGAPPCPNTRSYSRQPGDEVCPRSDTYRAMETGNVHSVFGWLFRCRTCKTMFFYDPPELKRKRIQEAQEQEMRRTIQRMEQERRR